MSSKTRHVIKRKIGYAMADVVNALVLLDDIYGMYFPKYADYAQEINLIRNALRAVLICLQDFQESI